MGKIIVLGNQDRAWVEKNNLKPRQRVTFVITDMPNPSRLLTAEEILKRWPDSVGISIEIEDSSAEA